MIQITLPDGVQTYSKSVRGTEITPQSGAATADKPLAMKVDGVLRDFKGSSLRAVTKPALSHQTCAQ